MSCPLHSSDWSCAGCAKQKLDRLLKAAQDANIQSTNILNNIIDDLINLVYEVAEHALSDGEDEFGNGWDDFQRYCIDPQIEAIKNRQAGTWDLEDE